jgi:hypothetical protein
VCSRSGRCASMSASWHGRVPCRWDMFAAVLFLQDEESDAFALGGDGEVRRCLAASVGWGSALCGSERCLMALFSCDGDESLDDAQGSALDGFCQAHGLRLLLEGGHDGVGFGESGRNGEWDEFGEAPGGDVDELDFVAAVRAVPVELLCVGDLAGLAGDADPGCPIHRVRTGFEGLDETAMVRGQFFEELVRVVRMDLRYCLGPWRCRLSPGPLRRFGVLLRGADAAVGEILPTFIGELGTPLAAAFGDIDQPAALQGLSADFVRAVRPDSVGRPLPHPVEHGLLWLVEAPVHTVLPWFPVRATPDTMPVAFAGIPGVTREPSFG